MKGGNKLFLFAGVGLALVAILLGITMSSGDKKVDAVKQEAPTKVTVVRLLQDIEPHQIIKSEMVETVELDTTVAPTDAVTSVGSVVNMAYMFNASTGDVLLNAFVEPPGITSSIDPGMRAMSLAVDDQGSMSGLLIAGDYVDVVFEARVDLRRLAYTTGGFEIRDDGTYSLKDEKSDDTSKDNSTDTSGNSDDKTTKSDDDAQAPAESGFLPFEGREGSEFVVLDGGDTLEPVAKMLIQDIKIIRVIPAGVSYDGQGQQVATDKEAGPNVAVTGQLILQVTPQQAEAVAFMQSDQHSYSVAVRGKDDHAIVATSGITFQILMSDGTWSLPWPEPVVADDAKEERATPTSGTDDATDKETT